MVAISSPVKRAGLGSLSRLTVKMVPSLLVAVPPDKRSGVTTVVAVQQVRRMRGGSQAHLMCCSDKNLYVVKFQNNPQHMRVLANEMLAGLLAGLVGLPVPEPVLVEVSEWLVQHTPDLNVQQGGTTTPCQSGLQFGSLYAVSPLEGQAFDHMPVTMLGRVRNLEAFAGMLAMDKWTCNADGRQAAFWRTMRQRNYAATFIDQGDCFNRGQWNFPDSPLRGVYAQSEVYAGVLGWDSFEPWLSRIEDLGSSVISAAGEEIPPIWYGSDASALAHLVRMVVERRTHVRDLLMDFRSSSRHPFPNWGEEAKPQRGVMR
jgi:hypothetical protein